MTAFCSTNCTPVSKCLCVLYEKQPSLLSQVSVFVDYNCRGLFRQRGKWPAAHSSDHDPDGSDGCLCFNNVDLVNHESTVPSRGGQQDGGGQRKGSAVVLNDYMGLKLLGWGQTGSRCLNDSQAKKVSCVYQRIWVWTVIIMWCWCAWVHKNTACLLLLIYSKTESSKNLFFSANFSERWTNLLPFSLYLRRFVRVGLCYHTCTNSKVCRGTAALPFTSALPSVSFDLLDLVLKMCCQANLHSDFQHGDFQPGPAPQSLSTAVEVCYYLDYTPLAHSSLHHPNEREKKKRQHLMTLTSIIYT